MRQSTRPGDPIVWIKEVLSKHGKYDAHRIANKYSSAVIGDDGSMPNLFKGWYGTALGWLRKAYPMTPEEQDAMLQAEEARIIMERAQVLLREETKGGRREVSLSRRR